MFSPPHCGLYFTPQHIATAKANRNRPPHNVAYELLATAKADDPLGMALVSGFRYHFDDDEAAAGASVEMLDHLASYNPPAIDTPAYMTIVAIGQVIEMVRREIPATTLQRYRDMVHGVLPTSEVPLLDALWVSTLQVVGGIVLEDADLFEGGVQGVQAVVDAHIRPEGYIPALVENADGRALHRQLAGAQALALAAEAATHVGADLWNYDHRGFTGKSPATYAAAYCFDPTPLTWDAPPTGDDHLALYQEHAGMFEMLNRHLRPEVLRPLLQDLRPIANLYGGGFVTLSHSPTRDRPAWMFWR